jgi:hypothetical protein
MADAATKVLGNWRWELTGGTAIELDCMEQDGIYGLRNRGADQGRKGIELGQF